MPPCSDVPAQDDDDEVREPGSPARRRTPTRELTEAPASAGWFQSNREVPAVTDRRREGHSATVIATTPSVVPSARTSFSGVVMPVHAREPPPCSIDVDAERGDHDDVVEDRGEHGRREPAVGVQQSARHGADPVEHDLRHEPAQEEGRQARSADSRPAGRGDASCKPDDPRGEDRAQDAPRPTARRARA